MPLVDSDPQRWVQIMCSDSIFPLPIKDWTDPDQYPDLESDDMRIWTWEFLRRNGSYQTDYFTFAARYAKLSAEVERLENVEIDPRTWLDGGPQVMPDPQDPEFQRKNRLFMNYWDERELYKIWFDDEWGIQKRWAIDAPIIPSPNNDRPPEFKSDQYTHITFGRQDALEKTVGIYEGTALATFDLRFPVAGQMKLLKTALLNEQDRLQREGRIDKFNRRRQCRLYPMYLRILDTRAAHLEVAEIGEGLYPNDFNDPPDYSRTQKVRKKLISAEVMRNSGYRHLLVH